jgi:acetoacetyl-CoA synthetase
MNRMAGGAASRQDFPAGRGYGGTLSRPSPGAIARARITDYASWLSGERGGPAAGSYRQLWEWSVTELAEFWSSIWDYFGVLGSRGDGPVLAGGPMPDVSWFGGATLNYARNALRPAATDPERIALIYRSEAGRDGTLTYGQLDEQVAAVRGALGRPGVRRGDRVAAYLPNSPHALIGLLATASLGAIWTSRSPDFGARAVIDRFAQVAPRVLIAIGTAASHPELPVPVTPWAQITAPATVSGPAAAGLAAAGTTAAGTASESPAASGRQLLTDFDEVPFDHPLWVVYSSGTTGLPKPIVHGHGGITLEHLKALCLHQDTGPADVFFWYTTTGWMMWNYLVGGLLAGAAVVAYGGSAVHPGVDALWRIAAQDGVTYFGSGAPYLVSCMKAGLRPGSQVDLSRLRGVGSTGGTVTGS